MELSPLQSCRTQQNIRRSGTHLHAHMRPLWTDFYLSFWIECVTHSVSIIVWYPSMGTVDSIYSILSINHFGGGVMILWAEPHTQRPYNFQMCGAALHCVGYCYWILVFPTKGAITTSPAATITPTTNSNNDKPQNERMIKKDTKSHTQAAILTANNGSYVYIFRLCVHGHEYVLLGTGICSLYGLCI